MSWAVGAGFRDDDPTAAALAALPRRAAKVEHHAAIAWRELPDAVQRVRSCGARPVVRLAWEMVALTACRTAEARGMTWAEADLDAAVWAVPADRYKTGRAHRVPLSARALAVLEQARAPAAAPALVFPGASGSKELAANAPRQLSARLGLGTVHGLRTAFPVVGGRLRGARPDGGGCARPCGGRGRGRLPALGPARAPAPGDAGVERPPAVGQAVAVAGILDIVILGVAARRLGLWVDRPVAWAHGFGGCGGVAAGAGARGGVPVRRHRCSRGGGGDRGRVAGAHGWRFVALAVIAAGARSGRWPSPMPTCPCVVLSGAREYGGAGCRRCS